MERGISDDAIGYRLRSGRHVTPSQLRASARFVALVQDWLIVLAHSAAS